MKNTSSPPKAIILAAAAGTRMHPLSKFLPKPLIPVAGKPMIVHSINFLERVGVKEICITMEPNMGPMIQKSLENGYEGLCKLHFVYQKERNGLGFAILECKNLIGNSNFIVSFPDEFHPSINQLDKNIFTKGNLLVVRKSSQLGDLLGKANVKVKTDGTVERIAEIFDEKKLMADCHLTGVLVFTPEIFQALEIYKNRRDLYIKGEFSICDSIQHLIDTGTKVRWIECGGFYKNVNSLQELDKVMRFLYHNDGGGDNV